MTTQELEAIPTRKSLPLTVRDMRDLERMQNSDRYRNALMHLSRENLPADASDARILHAVFTAGLTAVRQQVEEDGYAALAAQQDTAARRAEARRRRPSWADDE